MWGANYIERCLSQSIPALFAPGNIGAISKEHEVVLTILTTSKGVNYIQSTFLYHNWSSIIKFNFILIDDLMGSELYGVTLTLAYLRGIASEKSPKDVCFFFINSDFIVSDLALKNVLDKIESGYSVILSPSLRADEDKIRAQIEVYHDASDGKLIIESRELVKIALNALHPTVIGKTINQNAISSKYQNQLYWRVDSTSLYMRSALLSMFAIKPERLPSLANAYCDYGFIPDMCPSGKYAVMEDSDDCFILESQNVDHESDHLFLGSHDLENCKSYISNWLTSQHKRNIMHEIVIHSSNFPHNLDAIRSAADTFISKLGIAEIKTLSPYNHPWWTGIVPIWRQQVRSAGNSGYPPELTGIVQDIKSLQDTKDTRSREVKDGSAMVERSIRGSFFLKLHPNWTILKDSFHLVLSKAERSKRSIFIDCTAIRIIDKIIHDLKPAFPELIIEREHLSSNFDHDPVSDIILICNSDQLIGLLRSELIYKFIRRRSGLKVMVTEFFGFKSHPASRELIRLLPKFAAENIDVKYSAHGTILNRKINKLISEIDNKGKSEAVKKILKLVWMFPISLINLIYIITRDRIKYSSIDQVVILDINSNKTL